MSAKPTPPKQFRCAIYTRKSHEEGLEQDFNSLDAQRLAGENYIASQSHEGWVCLPERYDDGGFSGGTLERPALQNLLKDINAGKIDCIVVYKIDRLTRSLFDFSRLITVLEQHNTSFVSVTQSFNTSNSMGRLMLNVLLSFAQFEREVTGERIRDKIAASKAQGMWMGGVPPLGYDVQERKLLINAEEADTVRLIYRRYMECRSPMQVVKDLEQLNLKAKSWTSSSGKVHTGARLDLVGIWRILRNPVYMGFIRHKDTLYQGLHEAIIPPEEWHRLQEAAKDGTPVRMPGDRKSMPPLLKGLATCGCCRLSMTPTYTSKAKNGQRYRYYFCQAKMRGRNPDCTVRNVSAATLESAVREKLLELLRQPEILVQTLGLTATELPDTNVINTFKNLAGVWDELFPVEQVRLIRLMVKEVLVFPDGIDIRFYREGLTTLQQELKEAA